MSSWFQFWEIFHLKSNENSSTDPGEESEEFNCCVRSNSKPKSEDKVFTPRSDTKQPPTPWIREGYSPSHRHSNSERPNFTRTKFPVFGSVENCQDDITQLKLEILEVERAIDEGERRIRILDVTSMHNSTVSSKGLIKELFNLRAKASDLSSKLCELEALTTSSSPH